MNRVFAPIAVLLALTVLSGCEKAEAPAKVEVAMVAPTDGDDAAWKEYLGRVVNANQAGVTDRIFPYYLPNNSSAPVEGDRDGLTQYDRQLENVTAVVQRTVLPGNMLAFGSPDSTKMADLIVAAFATPDPNALKGSQVLFIGSTTDQARVQAAVEAAGGKFVFVEVK